MFKEQLIFLLPLALLITMFAVFQAFLLIKTKLNYYIKFLGIPILILGAFFAFKIFDSSLGYGYPTTDIPEKFVLLGFVVVETNKVQFIELWLQSEGSKTRLYKIPFSEGLANKLDKAIKERDKGMLAEVGQFRPGKNMGSDADWTDSFQFYQFNVSKIYSKGEAPPSDIQQ